MKGGQFSYLLGKCKLKPQEEEGEGGGGGGSGGGGKRRRRIAVRYQTQSPEWLKLTSLIISYVDTNMEQLEFLYIA